MWLWISHAGSLKLNLVAPHTFFCSNKELDVDTILARHDTGNTAPPLIWLKTAVKLCSSILPAQNRVLQDKLFFLWLGEPFDGSVWSKEASCSSHASKSSQLFFIPSFFLPATTFPPLNILSAWAALLAHRKCVLHSRRLSFKSVKFHFQSPSFICGELHVHVIRRS